MTLVSSVGQVSRRIRRSLGPVIRFTPWANRQCSYSQEGEDRILWRLFESTERGYYVDVGAHHPFRFSNTYLFYRRGWSGINLEPLPGSKRMFDLWRPRDTNLEIAVADIRGSRTYYQFDDPALNGFSLPLTQKRMAEQSYRLVGTTQVEVMPLRDVLARHVSDSRTIHFMSIDVEGMDDEVIASSDWQRYRPKVVLVECLEASELGEVGRSSVGLLLASAGYSPFAKTLNTVFFFDRTVAPTINGLIRG